MSAGLARAGANYPFLLQADAKGTATAMVVPACFMVLAWSYALCVNFVPAYRNPADKIGAATIGLEHGSGEIGVGEDMEKDMGVHKEVA